MMCYSMLFCGTEFADDCILHTFTHSIANARLGIHHVRNVVLGAVKLCQYGVPSSLF